MYLEKRGLRGMRLLAQERQAVDLTASWTDKSKRARTRTDRSAPPKSLEKGAYCSLLHVQVQAAHILDSLIYLCKLLSNELTRLLFGFHRSCLFLSIISRQSSTRS